jgi:hypothetical protein
MASDRACYGCYKLHDRLVRHSHRVLQDATPEKISRDLLLVREPIVEPVHQDIRINESGHGRKDPLASSPDPVTAASFDPSGGGGVRLPDRTVGLDLMGPQTSCAFIQGSPEPRRRAESIRFHDRDECGAGPRSLWVRRPGTLT